jgi:flagellar biosynthesis/type III secretory pathway M-ring protein FliF/YscJ
MELLLALLIAVAVVLLIWLYNKSMTRKYQKESEKWNREHQKELEELEKLKERSKWLATRDPEEHRRVERERLEALHRLYRTHPRRGKRS